MPLDRKDLKQIKDTVVEAVDPYFAAIQKDFNNVYERFDKVDGRFDKVEDRLERIDDETRSDRVSSLGDPAKLDENLVWV